MTQQSVSSRNHGVDLLRLLAMFYVLVLHVLGQGGVLEAAAEGTALHRFAWFLETWAYCAVDVFALISGYVSYTERERPVRLSAYLLLWFEAVWYGVLGWVLVALLRLGPFSKRGVLYALFPVTNGGYWYFTAYTGMFLLLPLVNAALRKCSEGALRKFVAVLFGLAAFSCLADRFRFSGGHSVIWLTLLYACGAAVKKCRIGARIGSLRAFAGIVLMNCIVWLWKLSGPELEIMKVSVSRDMFLSYTSPFVLGTAVCYLLIFSRLRLPVPVVRAVRFAAPCAFAVYLLNCNDAVWEYGMKGRFAFLAEGGCLLFTAVTVLFSLAFFIAAVLLDRVRLYLFERLRVREGAEHAAAAAGRLLGRIAGRL